MLTSASGRSFMTRASRAAPSLPRPQPVHILDPGQLELESVDVPREAFFGPTEMVPADEAVGRIAAEQVTPYPPGIPVLVSGERITAEVLDHLHSGLQAGMVLPDPTIRRCRRCA